MSNKTKSYRVYCDSCDAVAINGVACHETGCRRSREKWTVRRGGYLVPLFCETPKWAQSKASAHE